MWKKLWVAFIALAGVLTIGFACHNSQISAVESTTGVIELKYRTGSETGSKFVFGTYDGKETVYEAIKDQVQGGILAWSYGGVTYAPICSSVAACTNLPLHYEDTSLYEIEQKINAARSSTEMNAMAASFFFPAYDEIKDGGTFGLSSFQRTLNTFVEQNTTQWNDISVAHGERSVAFYKKDVYEFTNPVAAGADPVYSLTYGGFGSTLQICVYGGCAAQFSNNVRPAFILDKEKVAFAVAASLENQVLHSVGQSTSEVLKLRIKNSGLSAIFSSIDNKNGSSVESMYQNQSVYLKLNANAGGDGEGGINTVSVLVFDEAVNFVYYKPLERAKGNGTYVFDLSGIPKGKYKIGIVNEVFHAGKHAPADSSAVSQLLPLEIVEELKIKVTEKTGLIVRQNVNQKEWWRRCGNVYNDL